MKCIKFYNAFEVYRKKKANKTLKRKICKRKQQKDKKKIEKKKLKFFNTFFEQFLKLCHSKYTTDTIDSFTGNEFLIHDLNTCMFTSQIL